MDNKKRFASLMEDHSFLPGMEAVRNGGRSGSQSGDGESPCPAPSNSELHLDSSQDHDALSCVTKETSQEDCARHRFIVWAAVKRNSSTRMTSEERLECPLLRCTQRFPDHESMLKHLAKCRYLASGEYWCYDHMRVERFDDLKCKRCLGHPSKRRKMLSLAKNFFHSLGHKSKKGPGVAFVDDEVLLQPPPSYDSLDIPTSDALASELPSTEILEADSFEVPLLEPTPAPAPAPAPSDGIDPQALLMPAAPAVPALPELDSNESFPQWQPGSGFPLSSYPISPYPFQPVSLNTPSVLDANLFATPHDSDLLRGAAFKPALQLTTGGYANRRQAPRPAPRAAPTVPRSSMGLSPSSSVRSTASTDTNASAVSYGSSMISSTSDWSGVWSIASGLDTSMTSPVEGTVADELFADVLNSDHNDPCPGSLHDFFSELPADLPMLDNACEIASDPILGFQPAVPSGLAPAPGMVPVDVTAQPVEIGEPEVEQTNTCCSETKSLVSSAWDALQEHILSSMVKLQGHRGNYIANQLSSMSIETVAATGLRALHALIDGQQPSSASDALCLIHLVYAFSLVLHGQEAADSAKSLFLQSLVYVNGLPSNDRDLYHQMVLNIWQPPDFSLTEAGEHFSATSSNPFAPFPDPKGKSPEGSTRAFKQRGDAVLATARDFLDELEISLLDHGPPPLDPQGPDLHIAHLKDVSPTRLMGGELISAARDVLVILSQRFNDASLKSMLVEVYQRLCTFSICSTRRFEIEILHAGKSCLPTGKFFGDFVPSVRELCDRIYEQHDVGPSRRDVYHGFGVNLIESLVSEFGRSGSKPRTPPPDDIDMFLNDVSEAGDSPTNPQPTSFPAPKNFDDSKPVQLPTPTASPGDSPARNSGASPAAEPTQQASTETSEQQQAGQKVNADSCCDICGYRPKGDPQWFKGSMAKHRKLQHSTAPPKIYKCPFPGCTSQYKNRPDNLRQHQIEKNHWVKGDESTPRRPSKRKKVAEED
ncbi:uncharacterized protein B0H64DRAFT_405925 [Chaetomium fimeti]|uniref:Uncharacterized protein n=1 Tax=Chaetomium fimeti TaxID=1854472 RepID=A0AAE0H9B5_9PEZI|nr:hypothetical protein B0H64DRAFT_405925 [Chaetomium fimeti]